ncbi:MAG: Ribosomal large subunit pseudouridine synthase F [Candidatus Nomurabacteria bacterium GW2011_GWB1_37_5]|uniref:Pseudouridine synthase n=1 Tax=Candidatus Nomurabacteria bacterium GW2011_GWB1_37_5 TaxID=1618742 RepID=A0A0G0H1D7_9BACT|nr:MAG: Ribosomal large subunit pseudouridine synthase F [Candidatus Nomurabacteria bacterium GW2011_GWB1_37_5]
MDFPVRINKYLAIKNISTRRGADELIRAGKVKINGRKAKLGDQVTIKDKVEVGKEMQSKKYSYFAFNKPIGVVTHSPQIGEKDIKSFLSKIDQNNDLFPLGRLDKDSSGLIILTNDGRITDKMLNPKFYHEKEYSVEVDHPINNTFLLKIKQGFNMGKEKVRPAKIRKTPQLSSGQADPTKFDIILTEGKNRQIRRMCAALSYKVLSLKRIRIINIILGNLPKGQIRPIEGGELKTFIESLGLKN